MAVFGTWPRYDIYWEIVMGHTAEDQVVWTLPINPEIRTWVLFGFAYALGLAYALFGAWRASETGRDPVRLALLGALCMLGITGFSYYLGRSATPLLVFLAFPLAILFVVVVDVIWSKSLASSAGAGAYHVAGVLALAILAGMGGVFADRFFRPMGVTASNSTILRACLGGIELRRCNPYSVVSSLRRQMREQPGFPEHAPGAGGWSPRENQEAYELIQKFQKDITRGARQAGAVERR
jgi:hypothetical protein